MRKTIAKLWFQPSTPIVIVLLLAFAMYRFAYPTFQKAIKANDIEQAPSTGDVPTVLSDETAILGAVSKLIRLPQDETPRIIEITNIEEFKDQPFFQQAKNGDILLIYQKSKKVILFDPLANIIIDTAPIAASVSAEAP